MASPARLDLKVQAVLLPLPEWSIPSRFSASAHARIPPSTPAHEVVSNNFAGLGPGKGPPVLRYGETCSPSDDWWWWPSFVLRAPTTCEKLR